MLTDEKYQRLCDRVINRDSSCIEELYDAYGDSLYGVISRIVKSEEVAKELLQDTFMKIWQKGPSYNPKLGRLYTWMMRIARNGALNYLQSKANKQLSNIQNDEGLVNISDEYKSAENIEIFDIKGTVLKLAPKYQTVIKLIYFHGYTHKEVSESLGLPLGTVKSRIKIALRELKILFDYRLSSAVGILIMIVTLTQ